MQFKSESRCCEHRQNYAIAVNTEVNMTASASRSGTESPNLMQDEERVELLDGYQFGMPAAN